MPDRFINLVVEGMANNLEKTGLRLFSLLGPWVSGIEATQAIQYYRSAIHLTDSRDRAPDNSATIVAYKPLMVRAYVNSITPRIVTGTLKVERRRWQGWRYEYDEVNTFTPWLGSISTQNDTYDAERRAFGRTLNFRIPADDVAGGLRLTVTLDTGHSDSIALEARLVQTLRVRCFPIRYRGPSTSTPPPPNQPPPPQLNLPAPNLTDLQTTAADAFAMMPIQSTGSFTMLPAVDWDQPLDDPRNGPGACSNNWDALLTRLGDERILDGNRTDVVYYGLLPTGTPLNVPGCGDDGLGAAAVNNTLTFVHEIGHGYGFIHTPSGNAGATDPNYPTYEPYPSASIGEYGLDIRNGTVKPPNTFTDYMSYGAQQWMSLYQHERLREHPRLTPRWIKEPNPFLDVPVEFDREFTWWPDPPWTKEQLVGQDIQPMISVHGFIDESGRARIDSVARVVASLGLHGPQTSWNVQLVGAEGDIAARGRVARIESHGCAQCGCAGNQDDPNKLPFSFHAMLPDRAPGTALRILDPLGEIRGERQAPDAQVEVRKIKAEVQNDFLNLYCELSQDADVWAQWSNDEGNTWHGLTTGLSVGESRVALSGLPAGLAWVRLLVHDGFFTTTTEALPIEVPEQQLWPAIFYPSDTGIVPAQVEIEAHGNAVDQAGYPISDERLEWILDGETVGRGRVTDLNVGPGRHELSLRVSEADAQHTVHFEAVDIE